MKTAAGTIAPILTSTGGDAQRQLALMRGRLVGRYNLTAVPGRPEELIKPGTDLAVSIGYGCKTLRVRAMKGREWIDSLTADFQIREGWGADLYGLLDSHFGFGQERNPHLPTSTLMPVLGDVQTGLGDRSPNSPTRRIRDNPQG